MATNQMRREAAKRKLANQQQRRAERAKRRQRAAIITSVAVVVIVLVGVVVLSSMGGAEETTEAAAPAPVPGACTFGPTPEAASKPAPVPAVATAATTGTAAVTLQTSRGEIGLTLDRAAAPCTVESFLSLTAAGFYNDTPCHRLTTGSTLNVLQCGDPTGAGTGGPGYTVNDEKPAGLAPAGGGAASYPRGTIAMANTGEPNSGGSQFFLVYADSALPPDYTVFGTIGEPGLAVLDQIAADGLINESQPGDGSPRQGVQIQNVLAATG